VTCLPHLRAGALSYPLSIPPARAAADIKKQPGIARGLFFVKT
jgi:hypothetical protein